MIIAHPPSQRVWELADDCVHQDDRRLVDLQLAQAVHRHHRPDLHRVLEGGGQYKGVLWCQNFETWFSLGWGGAIRKTSLDWWGKCWKWSKASFQGGVDKNLLFVPSIVMDTKKNCVFLWFPNLKGRKETAEGHEQFLWKSCKEEWKEDPVV